MAEGVYDNVTCVEPSEADGGERVEMMVDVYMSADSVRALDTSTRRETPTQQTDAVGAQDTSTQRETPTQQTGGRTGSRCSRWAVVGVGLLCVLLLIMTVVLYMYHIKHQTSITTCPAERDTLLPSITNLTEERDQLKSSYQILTGEYKILQTKYDDLVKLAKWRKNENSFYFFSTEQKTWNESRQDCRDRGADLVIINSREEQMFLIDQKKEGSYWMGLTDEVTEDIWMWVDSLPLTEKFWKNGEPNNVEEEDCALFSSPVEDGQRTWNDFGCSKREHWLCEFNRTNLHLNTAAP